MIKKNLPKGKGPFENRMGISWLRGRILDTNPLVFYRNSSEVYDLSRYLTLNKSVLARSGIKKDVNLFFEDSFLTLKNDTRRLIFELRDRNIKH